MECYHENYCFKISDNVVELLKFTCEVLTEKIKLTLAKCREIIVVHSLTLISNSV